MISYILKHDEVCALFCRNLRTKIHHRSHFHQLFPYLMPCAIYYFVQNLLQPLISLAAAEMRRKICKTSILANTFGPLASGLRTILKLRHHMICTEENFLDCWRLVSLNLCTCHRQEMLTYSQISGQLILLQRKIDMPYPYLQGTRAKYLHRYCAVHKT